MKEYLANLLDCSTLPQKIVVIFDGVKYDVTASNDYMWGGDNYPFEIYQEDEMTIIATDDMNEHSIGAYVMKKETSGDLTKFAEFTFTGENAGGIYIGQSPCSFPCLENLSFTFDGVDYEVTRSEAESMFVYGEFSGQMPVFTTYPFVVVSSGMIMVADGDEHTLSISGDVSFTELVADVSVTISGGEGQVSDSEILEANKSYKLIFDEYVWYATCDSSLVAKFYNYEDNDDYTELWADEYTGMNWPTNGTYTISLYEMVE